MKGLNIAAEENDVNERGDGMKFDEYRGKVVFITGAASGIGRAQTERFIKNGAHVFALDLDEKGLAYLKAKYPQSFHYAVGDVGNRSDVKQAVAASFKELGEVAILLNTAGILDGYRKTLETDECLWDKVMNTNIKGVYTVTNAILPFMLEEKAGVIVNMASIAGLVAGGGGAAYTAAKHAIIGYTKQLDYDYCRDGIRANAIAPGAIKTPMNQADFAGDAEMAKWVASETPAGRWAEPEEVADVTLFIASEAANYMHGSVVPLDGGWMMR